MNFRIIEYIDAIGRYGNMTQAARELFITSSALNQQLLKTERELGVQLFVRAKHKLIPTEAGKICLKGIRGMLDIWEETQAELQDVSGDIRGMLKIGLPYDHGSEVFARVWPEFHEKYPGIKIQCYQLLVPELLGLIRLGEIDGAFLLGGRPEDWNGIKYIPLSSENLLLGLPKTHSYIAGKDLQEIGNRSVILPAPDLKEFAGDNFALCLKRSTMRTELIDPIFQEAGFFPNIMVESGLNGFLEKLTGEGLCCTIIPQSQVSDWENVAWLYLPGSPRFHFGIGFAKDYRPGAAMKYFTELAKSDAKRHLDFPPP
ncbi:MAG: LysR family transcriptional regulator [Synergistaceae bacterium]|nr:LysR family transcriptional regulator [Synergistaceae bacterium]